MRTRHADRMTVGTTAESSKALAPLGGPGRLANAEAVESMPKTDCQADEPGRDRQLSRQAVLLILAAILGVPFAFAVGLKVHPVAASAIAFAVIGLFWHQFWKRS